MQWFGTPQLTSTVAASQSLTTSAQPAQLSIAPALAIGIALVLVVVVVVWYLVRRRRSDQRSLVEFAGQRGLSALRESADLARVTDDLAVLFGEGSKVIDAFTGDHSDFAVTLVAYRFPEYRVDEDGQWDERMQESARRVLLIFRGFAADMPIFRLVPNNWAVNMMGGQESNTFGGVEPFGAFNFVLGSEQPRIRQLLGGDLQERLGRNKLLTVESRGDLLAFYKHADPSQPDDLHDFFERCVDIATRIRERAKRAVEAPAE
jgi:hypothetical protein